jgi:MraZ protein
MDDKGRISLPSDFRRVLSNIGESAVVITNYISDGARCIEGFGLLAWQAFEQKLRQRSRFDPKIQKLENFYLSRASECPLDGSGRILVPTHLRAYAGLERDVTFTASVHGFRMWDKRVWEVIFNAAEAALMADPSLFAEVDL